MRRHIPLTTPHTGAEELRSMKRVLESGILTEGGACRKFEREFARYIGCRHAMATSSGTAALHLVLLALGIGKGDEVIVPDFTFPATANVVSLTGASPVLVDIEPRTYNIEPRRVEEAYSEKTRAIIVVHLFGQSAEITPIVEASKRWGISVVEDAACAVGTTHQGRKVGRLGDVACFSFHPRKVMTTGEGGMVTTNNEQLSESIAQLKNHGAVKVNGKMRFIFPGYNYRLSDVLAAIGIVQLGKINRLIRSRIAIANLYHDRLASVQGIVPPYARKGDTHTYQSYVTMVTPGFGRTRDEVIQEMRKNEIETQIGTYALHTQPAFRDLSLGKEYVNSRNAYEHSLSLPISSRMKHSEVECVVKCMKQLAKSSW